ncbi:transcription termination factor 3, mitochondrial [Chanos chanos]|uniref:Transcription termination factor 3, mitochondrial n=1 Tax=Chanos chanos TaxID=29144 RepID=A0A6J2WHZ9_CHACN|nr:transcription termination factor 3, mitochondrial [Chanos chanos]
MHLCQRCVSVLRLSSILHNFAYVQNMPAISQRLYSRIPALSRPNVHLELKRSSQRNMERRRCGLMRYFCDLRASLSHGEPKRCVPNQTEREESSPIPYENPDLHHAGKTSAPLFDDQTVIDLDAAPRRAPFEEISDEEAIQISVPSLLPPSSVTLRDYVDKSETLSKLVQLGVNLWKLEQRPNVGSMLVRLDFQADVAPRLLFLKDLGLEDTQLGPVLTKNPFILSEDLENLEARVSYLKSKKFSAETVASMVYKAPYLLNFSVKRLENRLQFFQQRLGLSSQKTRDVLSRLPRLLCGSLEPVKENLKVCELEFGFQENEIQHMITKVPKVLTASKRKLTQIFDFVHNTMGVPHTLIAKFPQILNTKFLRIRERHMFLEYLGKAQYDPSQPNYISLDRLASLPDEAFCTEVASATLEDFERFQKTM